MEQSDGAAGSGRASRVRRGSFPVLVAVLAGTSGGLLLAPACRAQPIVGAALGAWYQGAQQRHPFVNGWYGLYAEHPVVRGLALGAEGSTTTIRFLGGVTDINQLNASLRYYLSRSARVQPYAAAVIGWREYRNWVEPKRFPAEDPQADFRFGEGAFFGVGLGARVPTATGLGFRLAGRWLHSEFENDVPLLDDSQNDYLVSLGVEWEF